MQPRASGIGRTRPRAGRRSWCLFARVCGLLLLPAALSGCQRPAFSHRSRPLPLRRPTRAVWVPRFQYQTPDDIRTIMRNCQRLGINTVIWQVRGNATVAYRSRIEPWSKEYNHRDPGFDPLALAVEEAHRRGLRIEAWVNVMPGWRGPKPPPIRDQLYWTHPAWFLLDAKTQRQKPGDFYLILNPCLPEVRDYITSVFEEIVTNYDVDGLHMDYVRYAWETTRDARQRFPRDPRTLELYRRETGLRPEDDPAAWDRWRANQLTRLVAQVHDMVRQQRPGLTLTAATWPDPLRGYREYFQDALGWLRAGLLDAAYPMFYTDDPKRFVKYIGIYRRHAPDARIIPGVGIYKHKTPELMREHLRLCLKLAGGEFCVFSYGSLHATAEDRKLKPDRLATVNRLRAMRRAVLSEFTRTGVARAAP